MQAYRHLLTTTNSMTTASLLAVAAGIAVGGLCGALNGLIITRLKLQPFVATLGMLGIARGVSIWLAGRTLIPFPPGGRPPWVDEITRVHAGTLVFNFGFWSLVALAILTAVLLHFTVLGRHIYAIGASEPTARLCGVEIVRTKVIVYTLSGLVCGWAGVLLFAHGASGNPSSAEGMELLVIAAVVIGGVNLTGGRGTVIGAIIGVLILGVLANGVSLFNVPVEVQHILVGIIIVASTALSGWRNRAARGRG
jgi:ribose/xylose/arabinose/galactoside ABC-type transport system permease subunit